MLIFFNIFYNSILRIHTQSIPISISSQYLPGIPFGRQLFPASQIGFPAFETPVPVSIQVFLRRLQIHICSMAVLAALPEGLLNLPQAIALARCE